MSDGVRFFGKYRGLVINNIDPEGRGRIQVQVPDVTQITPATFAEPCFPYTGQSSGFYIVPPPGAGVWVEFEQGDPSYPIWTGGWFAGSSEMPSVDGKVPGVPIVAITTLSNQIVLNDVPGAGGILLKTITGAKIEITALGITIDNGMGAKIELQGPQVNINSGALQVI
jgi:uncharacterized protein involved in type VI secretion and phage assembly